MNATLRDILLFSSGLVILMHQTFLADTASPTLVGAALAMMVGSPAVFRFLDWVTKSNDSSKAPPEKEGE